VPRLRDHAGDEHVLGAEVAPGAPLQLLVRLPR
jgi:hypothetical protein